jgi:drug/metabolite transporter superfamily protein YnfA
MYKVSWSVSLVARTLALFLFAGVAEIGGGWLVWQAVREQRPWWFALCGAQFRLHTLFVAHVIYKASCCYYLGM